MKQIVIAGGLVIVLAVGVYFYLLQTPKPDEGTVDVPVPEETLTEEQSSLDREYPAEITTTPTEEHTPEPPPETLEEADDYLRAEYEGEDIITNDLLAHDHLIDKFAAAGDAIWRDQNPAPPLNFLSPKGELKVDRRGGNYYLSKSNYGRYRPYLKALVLVSDVRIADTYLYLRPLFRQAHERLGNPHVQWDDLVDQVLVKLTEMKVPDEAPQLENAGKTYIFSDPELEKLPPAHKVLIRMGPEQSIAFQEKVRRLKARLDQAKAQEPVSN